MTRDWLSAAASLRASVQPAAPRPLESHEVLQRCMERFGANRDAARSAPLESPPQLLDAHLIADGEALEAAWQTELRAMIAARRGGAEALAAALAARAQSEAIVDASRRRARSLLAASGLRRGPSPGGATARRSLRGRTTSMTTACGPKWRSCRATTRPRRGARRRPARDAVRARAGLRSPPVRYRRRS